MALTKGEDHGVIKVVTINNAPAFYRACAK